MGSLKENLRGLREDRKLGEVLDDGDGAGSSECATDAGRTQISVSPAAPTAAEYKPGPRMDDNSDEEGNKIPLSEEISRGVCNNAEHPGPISVIQQPEAEKAAVVSEEKAISIQLPSNTDAGKQEEAFERKNGEIGNISIPVPCTPGPYDPRSPAPEGQHHMRTQVSLEVIQCHSIATSPMTPPEGGHSFFFPASLERFSGSDTKDAELQAGHQVEFCSVATSPMTPKTPFSTAFPEFVGRETVHKGERVEMSEGHGKNEVSARDEAQADVKSGHPENSSQDSTGASEMRPSVPESPAPFGCHNIRTQVSLEVVQCQSAATSPMTPPEGDQAFCFPSSFGRCVEVGAETKDAELQVGRHVEFRSVATAPMTPRTPTATTFPDIRKGASIEKIEEEMEARQEVLEVGTGEKTGSELKTDEDDSKEVRNCKEKCEEPVQEVSWDEKGMTWEVYGAVVEVAVLGSAIQKHLEKQVMKKRQPSMPPPPPLNPSAKPISLESIQGAAGKGRAGKRRQRNGGEVSRRRRNPFRLMMENMQQPHCCSKAHTTE
ncbi:unnamed protein product [Tetraodon nigroviridis]|uniref:(spotted green pufferfish) hypothetical protein n=1 Tax=Tetraodon nigroviridis TaxID=99883 RepID=Q4SYR5_TETNG|nr:unnamed protein product [Tetraodon nigroviridis]